PFADVVGGIGAVAHHAVVFEVTGDVPAIGGRGEGVVVRFGFGVGRCLIGGGRGAHAGAAAGHVSAEAGGEIPLAHVDVRRVERAGPVAVGQGQLRARFAVGEDPRLAGSARV